MAELGRITSRVRADEITGRRENLFRSYRRDADEIAAALDELVRVCLEAHELSFGSISLLPGTQSLTRNGDDFRDAEAHRKAEKLERDRHLIFSGGMLETDSARSITKVAELNNGELCLINWQHPAIASVPTISD